MHEIAPGVMLHPFSQKELNNDLLIGYLLRGDDPAIEAWDGGGFCWSLVFAWIYQILRFGAAPTDRIKQLCDATYAERLKALQRQYVNICPKVAKLVSARNALLPNGSITVRTLGGDDDSVKEKTKRTALMMNLSHVDDGFWADLDHAWALAQLTDLLTTREGLGLMLILDYKGGRPGHAVGCHKSRASDDEAKVHYFDSNYGEFVCDFIDTVTLVANLEQGIPNRANLQVINWYAFRLFHSPAPT